MFVFYLILNSKPNFPRAILLYPDHSVIPLISSNESILTEIKLKLRAKKLSKD